MNRYDWSKLDAGWTHHESSQGPYLEAEYYGVLQRFYYREAYGMTPFGLLAVEQLRKCRIRDTEPAPAVPQYAIAERFFDDVHKLMNEPYDHGSMIAAYGAPPPLPWRRGPLAAWNLVNISAHDGRLTVVMKRGRGELIDETGPDDDALWERLAAKVVDYEKAKAKAAAEKSDG